MRVLVVLAVVFAAASCGGGDAGVVTLTADDNLGEVDVGMGATIEVELESNASTGHRWEPAPLPDVLELVDDRYLEPDTDLVGAPGAQVVSFEVVAEGAGILRLEYVRPFDDPPVPEQVVEFVVRVDGAPWPPADPGPAPSTATAQAPVAVDDLASAEPGPVTVRGFVVWDAASARLCGVLMESFPAQCGGASVVIADPERLDVTFDEEQGVRWTPNAVVLTADYDGTRLTLTD